MCAFFFIFDDLTITLQSLGLIWGTKFCASSLLLPPLIFSYLQDIIHDFLWWLIYSWIIFSFKWSLRSSFFLLHFVAIDLQEAKDSIDEEDPRPTCSTWSYIMWYQEHLHLGDVLLLLLFFCLINSSSSPCISSIVLWFGAI